MIVGKKILLDISKIKDENSFHLLLQEKFGFFEEYGKNIHALVDCLSELRTPNECSITNTYISNEESLLIEIIGFEFQKINQFLHLLMSASVLTNRYEIRHMKRKPSIYLLFSGG